MTLGDPTGGVDEGLLVLKLWLVGTAELRKGLDWTGACVIWILETGTVLLCWEAELLETLGEWLVAKG